MNAKLNIVGQYLHRQAAVQSENKLKNVIQPQMDRVGEAMEACINIGAGHSAIRRLAERMKALTTERETLSKTLRSDVTPENRV